MAIARKPQELKTHADEKKVVKLIGKGAKREILQVFFRAPANIIEKADAPPRSAISQPLRRKASKMQSISYLSDRSGISWRA